MFDWIFNSLAGMWIAWNYWSIVPVIVFVSLSILFYKRLTSPSDPSKKSSYKENQKAKLEGIPRARLLMTMVWRGVILSMGGILFSISMFKMFS